MTEAQRALALSCIQNAGEIGSGVTTVNNAGEAPCCALGWLLYCANVPMSIVPEREFSLGHYIEIHPELENIYGLNTRQVSRIYRVNDSTSNTGSYARREAVLSLISSFPCESETP